MNKSGTHVANRFSNELLMWLVTVCSGVAPASALEMIQRQMARCDDMGNRNASLPPGEDLAGFVSSLATCLQRSDVDKLVKNVEKDKS